MFSRIEKGSTMKKQGKWPKQYKKNPILNKPKKITKITPFMNRTVKKIIFAVCSSLFIGTIFGIIILQMSKQEEPNDTTLLNISTNGNQEQEEEKQIKQLDAIYLYVVQAGVFSEKENAEQWGTKYKNLRFPAFSWQRNNEYYVLTGIASTEQIASQYAKEMDSQGLDVYVKEWEISEVKQQVTEVDYQLLHSFVEQWRDALHTFENDGKSDKEWSNVFKQTNELSDPFQQFHETVLQSVQELDGNQSSEIKQQTFMKLLYEYEQLIHQFK